MLILQHAGEHAGAVRDEGAEGYLDSPHFDVELQQALEKSGHLACQILHLCTPAFILKIVLPDPTDSYPSHNPFAMCVLLTELVASAKTQSRTLRSTETLNLLPRVSVNLVNGQRRVTGSARLHPRHPFPSYNPCLNTLIDVHPTCQGKEVRQHYLHLAYKRHENGERMERRHCAATKWGSNYEELHGREASPSPYWSA